MPNPTIGGDPIKQLIKQMEDVRAGGIACDIKSDPTVPGILGPHWRIKVGDHVIHGVNTTAGLALLDGVVIGAEEARRADMMRGIDSQ